MKLVECVPNFSEGRRPEVVAAIRDAIAGVLGATILDSSSDASHNRSVITFVVPYDRAVEAAFAGIKEAAARIDLRTHSGEHPRIGATDVVPFVPLEGATMDDCITLARELGKRVGDELKIPVLANITEFGKTPLFTTKELAAAGVRIALYPLSAFRAMNAGALTVYSEIRARGTQKGLLAKMQTRAELYESLNYKQYG